MIIDMRLRPPFTESFLKAFYNKPSLEPSMRFAETFGMGLSPSIYEKSIDLCLREMDEVGIKKAVVAVRRALDVKNDDLVQMVNTYPERFIGMAGIDPLDGTKALDDIESYVLNGSCVGISMEPAKCAEALYINDQRLYPIYEMCQAHDLPIVLSFGGFIGPDYTYTKPDTIHQVLKDFRDLRIVVSHGGWPYVNEMCHMAYKYENFYLSPDLYSMNVPGANDYLAAANYLIPQKIIFGSAYPMISFQQAVAFYQANIRTEKYAAVMYENAARFLKL